MKPGHPPRSVETLRLGALVALLATGCTTAHHPASSNTRPRTGVCQAFDAIDWKSPSITENDSLEQTSAKLDQRRRDDQRVADAASGALKTEAEGVVRDEDRYRTRFLAEWQSAGDGHQLHRKAALAGFFTSSSYVESLVYQPSDGETTRRRTVAASLASECAGLKLLDPPRLDKAHAPSGEVLAVKLDSNEIHRFSTDGTDLGKLSLPDVEAPIRDLSLSPDGEQLAFDAGTSHRKGWVINLTTGTAVSSTGVICADWDDDNSHRWAMGGLASGPFIARILPDGALDPATRIDREGCPYRFSSSMLAAHVSPFDGAPSQIDLIPKNGDPPSTLVATSCNLVAPRISPDSRTFAITTGCRNDAESGVYLVDANGKRYRQLTRGVAAAATWSTDGAWLTFGTYDVDHAGDASKMRVVISTVDGKSMGAITPAGYSWPIWVPREIK